MLEKVYTLGCSSLDLFSLVSFLRDASVSVLFDIRGDKEKSLFSFFTPKALKRTLGANGIEYDFFPLADASLINHDEEFVSLVGRIADGGISCILENEENIMKRPKSVILSLSLKRRGRSVTHISDGELLEEDDLENMLLDKFVPLRSQGDLFSGFMSDEESLDEAYREYLDKLNIARKN